MLEKLCLQKQSLDYLSYLCLWSFNQLFGFFYQENQFINVKVKAKLIQVSNVFSNHRHAYLPTVNNRQVCFGRGDYAGWFFDDVFSCLNNLALT